MIVLNWSDNFAYENNESGGLIARMCKKFTPDCWDVETEKADDKPGVKNQIKVEALVF